MNIGKLIQKKIVISLDNPDLEKEIELEQEQKVLEEIKQEKEEEIVED